MTDGQSVDGGLLLCGCGKMGSALLDGWLAGGLDPGSIHVVEPYPSTWLESLARETGLGLNAALPEAPGVCIIAVKPQVMESALQGLRSLGTGETLVLSIAAGVRIRTIERAFGGAVPVIRAMPNTPAAIRMGVTAIIGNARVSDRHMADAEQLLGAVGETVRLESEDDMDVVTAVSGSGPAYVFLMIEALAAAGEKAGLSPEMALSLARSTVSGAGALASSSGEPPSRLRENVTSPNGTTAAALEILMRPSGGLHSLMDQAVIAARDRSRELGG